MDKMSVTVYSKDVGDVKDYFRGEVGCKRTAEDRIEEYIKLNMELKL